MCNYDYEIKEQDEGAESKSYRQKRGNLLEAIDKVKMTLNKIQRKLFLFQLNCLYQGQEIKKDEVSKILKLSKIISHFRLELTEEDCFILYFCVPKIDCSKEEFIGKIETNFNDDKVTKEISDEIKNIESCFGKELEEIKCLFSEELVELFNGFDYLEKALLCFCNF